MTTDQHHDKDQQNYLLDQARTINDEIEVSVFGPSGMDTSPCAEAWATAKLIAKLLHRIEALEVAAKPNHPPEIPDSSLVERVARAMNGATEWQARAAIREVADWMRENPDVHFPPALVFALEQEAER